MTPDQLAAARRRFLAWARIENINVAGNAGESGEFAFPPARKAWLAWLEQEERVQRIMALARTLMDDNLAASIDRMKAVNELLRELAK